MTISQMCVLGLMAIAAIVTVLQAKKKSAWAWIVAYWALLTVKNAVDWWRG